jgi:hypothetical protein
MQLQNFSKIFLVQKKVFGPVQISKKTFFEFFNFFHRFLGIFVPVPKAKNWYISDLVPVLKVKCTNFSHLVPVQRPQEIDEKNSKIQKKFFLDICTGPNTFFWT